MATLATRLLFEPVRSLAYTSITGSYVAIGTPLLHPARQIFIQNDTDVTLMFSLDGVNNHFPLPTYGFILLDITSNKTTDSGFYIAQGTQFYVKEVGTPSLGTVYVSAMYGFANQS